MKKIYPALFASAMLLLSASCSDDNSVNEGEDLSNLTVVVEMSYTLQPQSAGITGAELSWSDPDNLSAGASATVAPGETFTRKLTYNTIPDGPVGFLATPSVDADLDAGTDVTVDYTVDCTVSLLNGNNVVDFKKHSDNVSYTLFYNPDEHPDLTDDFLFAVTTNNVRRVNLEDLFDDEDDALPEELPVTDDDDVKCQGHLFYVSQANADTDNRYLYDNFVTRFSSASRWDGSALSTGDFLFLYRDDLNNVSTEVIKKSVADGAILVIDALNSFADLKRFCEEADIYNPLCEDDDVDVSQAMFIIADADRSISDNPQCGYRGMFFMLNPGVGSDNTSVDYHHGEVIDRAVATINEMVSPTQPTGRTMSRAAGSDLTGLINAYKVHLCEKDNSHTLSKNAYQDPKRAGRERVNHYDVEYDIYNVFSLSEHCNYYYIHQNIICSFGDCYIGVYNKAVETNDIYNTIAKVCEWYGSTVKVTTEPTLGDTGMKIHCMSPATTESSTGFTSGFSWDLGGSVGYESGAPAVSANTGIGINTSHTYDVKDVTVANKSVPHSQLSWQFNLANAWTNFSLFKTACTNMHQGALAGRETFTVGTDFVISFPEKYRNNYYTPRLIGTLEVTLRRTCGKCGEECAEETNTKKITRKFDLPALRESSFK